MDFLSFMQTRDRILLDGAVGTQLEKRGLVGVSENNIVAPEAVLEIQREYARCRCDALITNTLTMNRVYVETHEVDIDVREVNLAGAQLARRAVEDHQFVLGNISSTGQLLEPYGNYEESDFHETFREQAEILAEAGVDGFIIETMFDLREALCALRACKENVPLPVIASIAFATEKNGGRTSMGNSAEECAKSLTDAGADAVGANCGDLDPSQMAVVVSLLRSATSLPVLAEPNAGKPDLVDGKIVFDMSPDDFAAGVAECLRAGASIVGGCCGTSPEHIRAVKRVLEKE